MDTRNNFSIVARSCIPSRNALGSDCLGWQSKTHLSCLHTLCCSQMSSCLKMMWCLQILTWLTAFTSECCSCLLWSEGSLARLWLTAGPCCVAEGIPTLVPFEFWLPEVSICWIACRFLPFFLAPFPCTTVNPVKSTSSSWGNDSCTAVGVFDSETSGSRFSGGIGEEDEGPAKSSPSVCTVICECAGLINLLVLSSLFWVSRLWMLLFTWSPHCRPIACMQIVLQSLLLRFIEMDGSPGLKAQNLNTFRKRSILEISLQSYNSTIAIVIQ